MAKTKTNRAAEILTKAVTELASSDAYVKALQFRKSFHNYSFRNCILISMQCPEATAVAGYKVWQKKGRQVRKGEKSIAILAPMVRKDDDGTSQCFGFRTVSVFDVSQTEGDELPTIEALKPLKGSSDAAKSSIDLLIDLASSKGMPVEFKKLERGFGCWNSETNEISIEESLDDIAKVKTLVHEIGHGMFKHSDKVSASVAELEAESVAYIVCDSLGIDTSDYSFKYLASWSEDPSEIVGAAQRACKIADEIIAAVAV